MRQFFVVFFDIRHLLKKILHQTRCFYFPFLFPSPFLQSFFSFSASSVFGIQHHLTNPPAKSSNLPLKKMPVFQGVAPWHTSFTLSYIIPLRDQHKLTHPLVKSSTFPLREIPVFQGAAPWHANFILSCVVSLWDSAPAQSTSGKKLNPSSQKDARFSGRCSLGY